jgi:hypothetical protein
MACFINHFSELLFELILKELLLLFSSMFLVSLSKIFFKYFKSLEVAFLDFKYFILEELTKLTLNSFSDNLYKT